VPFVLFEQLMKVFVLRGLITRVECGVRSNIPPWKVILVRLSTPSSPGLGSHGMLILFAFNSLSSGKISLRSDMMTSENCTS
jgi:hypothetical protein